MLRVGDTKPKTFLGNTKVKVYLGDVLISDRAEDSSSGVLPKIFMTNDVVLHNYRIYGSSTGCGVNTVKVAVAELEQGTLRESDGVELSSNYRVRTKLGELYPAGSYTISFTQRQKGVVVYVYDENETYKKSESLTDWQQQPVTITITEPRYIRFVIAKLANGSSASTEYKIVPTDVTGIKLTTADPLGYNLPIISRTANRFGGALQQGTLVSTGYEESSSNKVRCSMGEVLPAGTYIIDADGVGGGIAYVYDSSYTKTNDTVTTWSALPLTITLSQAGYLRPVFAANSDGTGADITPSDVSNVIIAESSEYSGAYVPYQHTETLVEIGSTPLGLGEYVSFFDGKIYRYSGGVLTPENPPTALPDIPTFTEYDTVIDYEDTPPPEDVYLVYGIPEEE